MSDLPDWQPTLRKIERERSIESYYKRRVKEAGGFTRKLKGRLNDPDQLTIWPESINTPTTHPARLEIHFVELKRPKGKARKGQLREHARLRAMGCRVLVLTTRDEVHNYVRTYTAKRR